MLGFFAFIIIFILIVGLVIISTIFGFIRSIFSFGKHNKTNQNNQSQDIEQPPAKSKIFDKKEGEYVDFEEIK